MLLIIYTIYTVEYCIRVLSSLKVVDIIRDVYMIVCMLIFQFFYLKLNESNDLGYPYFHFRYLDQYRLDSKMDNQLIP